ncbi:GNAT family N-acetyltransferase [Pedobacter caeni]|uniref:Acetyltransferase (GNAT) domain-containing protein n=1 Tax=Pedobacter caeni TaxID=288992 RepID=A0A1M4TQV8_9SPHI|nr:GNAT family N-acetyltransferase [Pedobacter caeni]SHE46899.1 Acetyltransferase (GNAT) domain-containing protein [Pedobacter caeni]
MNIKVAETIEQKSFKKIAKLLFEYNLSKTQEFQNEVNKPIEIIVRNERNQIIRGLYGRSIWGTLEINTCVVIPQNRNEGIGQKLIIGAEKEAKNRNCRFISLNTFSFQVPEFYEKLGFEKIGIETDFQKDLKNTIIVKRYKNQLLTNVSDVGKKR